MIANHSPFFEISDFGISICFGRIEAVANELPYHKSVLAPLQQIHIVPFGNMPLKASKTLEYNLLFAVRTFSDIVVSCGNLDLMLTEGAIALLKLFGNIVIKDIVLIDTVFCYPFAKILWRGGSLLQILVPRVCHSFVLLHQPLAHNVVLKAGNQFNCIPHFATEILSYCLLRFTAAFYFATVKVRGPRQTPKGSGKPLFFLDLIGKIRFFFFADIDLI